MSEEKTSLIEAVKKMQIVLGAAKKLKKEVEAFKGKVEESEKA